jgi:protein phosphatase
MGGAAGGEIASRLAVETVLAAMSAGCGAAEARQALHVAIAAANAAVLERAERDPGLYGMGTTLVALMLGRDSPRTLIAHAGDSRCYLFRGDRLSRRTQDHSLVEEQMRLGTMTQEEAERSPFRSVITRAIGTQKSVTEDMLEIDTEAGDLFLLCTDGLTREVSEEEIARLLRAGPDLHGVAHQLIDAANQAGGRDNITCLLVQIP